MVEDAHAAAMAYFDSLPDELVASILAHAAPPSAMTAQGDWVLSQVNRRFRRLFFGLVSSASLGLFHPRVPHDRTDGSCMVGSPLLHCENLSTLALGCCAGLGDSTLCHFARVASARLATLRLRTCRGVSDAGTRALAEGVCKDSLRVLDLDSHPIEGWSAVTDETLFSFAQCCPELKVLRIWMWQLGSKGAEAIAAFGKLEMLKLRGVSGLDDAAVRVITRGCRSLTSIDLANAPEITDAAAVALADGACASVLEDFQLTNNSRITDKFVRLLASGCRGIQSLHFGSCPALTDQAAAPLRLCQSLAHLAFVNVRMISDASLEHIQACSALESLALEFCDDLSATGLTQLTRLHNLRDLSLRYCPRLGHAAAVALSNCRNLRVLDLTKTQMDDGALGELLAAPACVDGTLKSLVLGSCPAISRALCEEASKQFPNLSLITQYS